MYKYKHHNAAFSIVTTDIQDKRLRLRVELAIVDVFKGFLIVKTNNVRFEFVFTDNIKRLVKDSEFVRAGNIKVGKNQIHFRDNELNFLINHSEPFKVIVNVSNNRTVRSFFPILNKTFQNNIHKQVSIFYYRVFLLFSQLWNLENGLSYLHSSAVSFEDKAIIFTADSGVGKSSLLIKLSQEKRFGFLADDLTIVSSDSKVFYQGRSMSIKPYHLQYYPFLMKKLRSLMSVGQKLQWILFRDNRLTYRISPNDLFQKVVESSEIKRVIHLCNHSSLDFRISDLSENDFIKYATSILTNEFFLANHKLNTLASLPDSSFINTSVLYKRVSDLYFQAFKDVEIKIVFVPYMSDPNDLYHFLKSEGCLS
jgi:hypothetical protein